MPQLLGGGTPTYTLATVGPPAPALNSVLGAAWTVLNPLAMMLVFTVVFSFLLTDKHRGEKYPLFLLCGLLPWNYFSAAVMGTFGYFAATSFNEWFSIDVPAYV